MNKSKKRNGRSRPGKSSSSAAASASAAKPKSTQKSAGTATKANHPATTSAKHPSTNSTNTAIPQNNPTNDKYVEQLISALSQVDQLASSLSQPPGRDSNDAQSSSAKNNHDHTNGKEQDYLLALIDGLTSTISSIDSTNKDGSKSKKNGKNNNKDGAEVDQLVQRAKDALPVLRALYEARKRLSPPSSNTIHKNNTSSSQMAGKSSSCCPPCEEGSHSSHGLAWSKEVIVEYDAKDDGKGETKERKGNVVAKYVRTEETIGMGNNGVYGCVRFDATTTAQNRQPKQYALKVISKEGPSSAASIQNEIDIHRSLSHKHICHLDNSLADPTNHYLLLELCANSSLDKMIKQRKGLTEPEVRYYTAQLVSALKYLHEERRILHRDLKPKNCFLDHNMNLKLGDFGFAVDMSNGRSRERVLGGGTPNYMSPEMVRMETQGGGKNSAALSFESDIWALGVTVFAMFVGRPPYKSDKKNQIFEEILANSATNGAVEFPSSLPVSLDARQLIAAILKPVPADRLDLNRIAQHPFLIYLEAKMPHGIPHCATHVPPVWRVDDRGELYAAEVAEEASVCHPSIILGPVDTSVVDVSIPDPKPEVVVESVDATPTKKEEPKIPPKTMKKNRKKKGADVADDDAGDKKKSKDKSSSSSKGPNIADPFKSRTNIENSGEKSKESKKNEDVEVSFPPSKALDERFQKEENKDLVCDDHINDDSKTIEAPQPAQEKSKSMSKKNNDMKASTKGPPQDDPAMTSKDNDSPVPKEDEADCIKIISLDDLSPEAKARHLFWQNEKDHETQYTSALEKWGTAEAARQQTRELRRKSKDPFARPCVRTDDVASNVAFMKLLGKECKRAYTELFGHRTHGTIKVVESEDASRIGRYGKIEARLNDPLRFEIELHQSKVEKLSNTIVRITCRAHEIDFQATDKNSKAKSKKNGKKKGGKKATAAGSAKKAPSEYTFILKGAQDFKKATVTTSDLDRLAGDPSNSEFVLEEIMSKKNETEDAIAEAKAKALDEELRKKKKEKEESMKRKCNSAIEEDCKSFKKAARMMREHAQVEKVLITERPVFKEIFDDLDVGPLMSMLGGEPITEEDAKEILISCKLVLDEMTDIIDLYSNTIAPGPVEVMLQCIDTIETKSEAMVFAISEMTAIRLMKAPSTDRVYLMFRGSIPVASVKDNDHRLKGFRLFHPRADSDDDASADGAHEMTLEENAELLGVSPDASKQEIVKAFRKAARYYHPDKFTAKEGGISKEEAEEEFKKLSNAKDFMLEHLGSGYDNVD